MTLRAHLLAAVAATLSQTLALAPFAEASAAEPGPAKSPHATAICGPGDKPETGLQGETPLKDIASGRNKQPYSCGMRIVGHTPVEGGGGIMRRSRSCVYVSGAAGVRVVDMSDPSKPKPLGLLTDPGAVGTSETFNVIDLPDRHVLVAGKYSNTLSSERVPMSIYDITDCTQPKLMSTYYWPGDIHVPTIFPDGKLVYISRPFGVSGVMVADISNLSQPKFVGNFPLLLPGGRQARCHDLSFNPDGTRMYCPGSIPTEAERESNPGPSVWDVTQITAGKTNAWPPIRFVGEADVKGQGDHDAPYAVINGKPYLVAGAELGCNLGKTDFPSIFDISDETKPRKVGEFRLEVMERCVADSTFKATQKVRYGLHYNSVVDNAWGKVPLGMFSFMSAGVRIVDLRDPAKPREVAYYHPGAPAEAPPASNSPFGPTGYSDSCMSHNYFDQATGHIWFACRSGVYVAELTPEVRAYLGVETKAAK